MGRRSDSRLVWAGTGVYAVLYGVAEGLARAWPATFGFGWTGSWGTGLDLAFGAGVGLVVVLGSWPFMQRTRAGRDLARRLAATLQEVPAWGAPFLAISAAVAEEALFRGVLWAALEAPLGSAAAWALTSLLFGAAHGLFRRPLRAWSVFALVVGALLGALRLPGGILAPTLAHAVVDLVNLPLVRRVAPAYPADS